MPFFLLQCDFLIITQLLEGIGAISAVERKKAMSCSGNYQDSVTAPLSCAFDDDTVGKDDEDEQDEVTLEIDHSSTILSAVEKAGAISFVPHDLLTLFYTASKNNPCHMIKPPTQAKLAQSGCIITTLQG